MKKFRSKFHLLKNSKPALIILAGLTASAALIAFHFVQASHYNTTGGSFYSSSIPACPDVFVPPSTFLNDYCFIPGSASKISFGTGLAGVAGCDLELVETCEMVCGDTSPPYECARDVDRYELDDVTGRNGNCYEAHSGCTVYSCEYVWDGYVPCTTSPPPGSPPPPPPGPPGSPPPPPPPVSSITISGYDAKIAKASTPPLADSYSGPPASNVDVSMNLTIVSGCGVDQCDLTYWFYCNAGGPLTDAFIWTPVYGKLSDGDTAPRYFTNELCNYTTPGASYTAEGIVRVSRSGYTDAVASDTMPVSIAGTAPTVNLSAAPTAVTLGNSSNLTWTTTDATACSAGAAPSNTNWTGPKVVNGSQSTGALNQNTTFFLTCTGPGGSAQDQVTVTVDGPSPDVSVAITAVNSSGSFSLKDVKDGDILTFEIVYRNSGTGTATNVHNVEINLSNNHSYESGYVCPSCAGPPPDPQQMTFNRNVPLLPGASFTVSFNSRVNTSSNTQPFEILTVNTNGIFNPGALPFDTTYALLAAPNRPPSPGFEEVAP